MLLYIILGIIFMLLGVFIEQKRKARRIYKEYLYKFQNESLWQSALEKIIYEKDYNALTAFINFESQVFLYVNNDDKEIYKIDVNNKKDEKISLFQFQTVLKKIKKERTIYKFSLQTISIFHQFREPFNHWILCVKHKTGGNLPVNKTGTWEKIR